ncbi:MAG: FtsX-like permease family protein [Corticimicrobacter sp.]|uniref:ABC transporter permease n=1 Tax=Corticimicrobacter sp. TaxID=2678536 RepID=UPI0032DB2E28
MPIMTRRFWQQAIRFAWRDARAGELGMLCLALLVAVAALAGVGLLADRVERTLGREAGQMLGADSVLRSDTPLSNGWEQEAQRRGLQLAHTWQFPSMARFGQDMQLASVKAVSPDYPLRGQVRVARTADDPVGQWERGAPVPGSVWAEPRLLAALGADLGDSLALGNLTLRIDGVLTYEPDREMRLTTMAPRLMLSAEDLARSGLIVPGSRIDYALLVAGTPEQVGQWERWLAPQLKTGLRLDTLEEGRPAVHATLVRAQQFLSLVALTAAMMAALAIALGSRRFLQRHRAGMAVMRCLGSTQADITALLLAEFFMAGLVAALAGMGLGYAAHGALLAILGDLLPETLAPVGLWPALRAALLGLWLLLAFAWPALDRLRRVPPMRVLRPAQVEGNIRGAMLDYAPGLIGLTLLLAWFAGDWRLGGMVALGFTGAALIFALAAHAGLMLAGWLARAGGRTSAWRMALAGMRRRRAGVLAQVVTLALGLMAILVLALARTDLVGSWQASLPADMPNRFVINIQDDQRDAVQQSLLDAGVSSPELAPMIRGRLVSINGEAVDPARYEDPRAQRQAEREFNLSYADALPGHNRIVQGRALDGAGQEVSLEEELALRLGIGLGDRIAFDVAGDLVEVSVSSIRQVDWNSMQVNFFAILSPAALERAPRTWITSFHLPDGGQATLRDMVRAMPGLTVFDVTATLLQLRQVLDQTVAAVQLLFGFTLAAGILVLAAALSGTLDERRREAGILRALGAGRVWLARVQRYELLLTGFTAGLLASAAAVLLAQALARYIFDFDVVAGYWVWLAGPLAGMLAAWAGGSLVLRQVLHTPPLAVLRDA